MILLDTHVVYWLAVEPEKLSAPAKRAIEDARNKGAALYLSAITLWELAVLAHRGRIKILGRIEAFLDDIIAPLYLSPITPAIAALSASFPDSYPRDPTDRIIGATAQAESLTLITADRNIRNCKFKPFATVW